MNEKRWLCWSLFLSLFVESQGYFFLKQNCISKYFVLCSFASVRLTPCAASTPASQSWSCCNLWLAVSNLQPSATMFVCRVLLEKLTVTQQITKSPLLCKTEDLISTVFIKACHRSLLPARLIHSTSFYLISLTTILILPSYVSDSLPRGLRWVLRPQGVLHVSSSEAEFNDAFHFAVDKCRGRGHLFTLFYESFGHSRLRHYPKSSGHLHVPADLSPEKEPSGHTSASVRKRTPAVRTAGSYFTDWSVTVDTASWNGLL